MSPKGSAVAEQSRPDTGGSGLLSIRVDGMSFASCVDRVETAIRAVLSVASASVNLRPSEPTSSSPALSRVWCAAKMIRYYDSIGLVPAAVRTTAGYRTYAESDIHALRCIRRARDFGFSIGKIERLLSLWRDRERACAEVKAVATAHIQELQVKIAELEQMASTLGDLAEHCDGDHRPDGPIIDDLA